MGRALGLAETPGRHKLDTRIPIPRGEHGDNQGANIIMVKVSERPGWTDAVKVGRPVPAGIEVGRRFVASSYRKQIWEIVSVARYVDEPMPHVKLSRVGAPYDTKTLSAAVLMDRRFFHTADEA